MSTETLLREALAARADEVGPSSEDAYARVSGAIRTSQRRRRAAGAGAVALVAAVAVAVPTLGRSAGDRHATPATRTSTLVPGPHDPRWSSMASWPTRGSLATDTAFLAAVEERLGTGEQNQVLYAGDIGARRVVVVWSRSTGSDTSLEQLHLGTAPRGSAAVDVTSQAEGAHSSENVVLVRLGMRPDSPLLVLATPASTAGEVSASARVNVDGSVTRTPWQRFGLTDGTAVVELTEAPTFLTRVRVGGFDGQATGLVDSAGAQTSPAICLDLCKDFDQRFVEATSFGVAQQLGVSANRVSTTLVYSGPVDAAAAAAAGVTDASRGTLRLVVADSRVGDAVLRSALLVHAAAQGSAETRELLTSVPLDALAPQPQPFVLRGLDRTGRGQVFEVFAPGAAAARITSTTPTILPDSERTPVTGGSATIRLAGAEMSSERLVETYDAAGDLLGSWELDPPNSDDPFDTQP